MYCYSRIVSGPDGNLYFAERRTIGRMTARKVLSTLPVRPDYGPPQNLTVGPDHNLWFVGAIRDPIVGSWMDESIARMKPDGRTSWYRLKRGLRVDSLAAGADGALWLAAHFPSEIIRMTTDGRVTATYEIHGNARTCDSACTPLDITAGPDGNMWFTVEGRVIGRISRAGRIALFPLPGQGLLNQPFAMSVGQDGRLWFSEIVASRIGAIAPDGRAQEYTVPGVVADDFPGLTKGGDHNIWFTQTCSSNIGRVTPAGQVTSYHIPGTPRTRDSCPYFMP
jgi:virginiamycin B lyase